MTIFSVLTVFVSGFILLVLIGLTFLPVIRKYTIINKTNEKLYITPLIQYYSNPSYLDDENQDSYKKTHYIENVSNFSILSQYRSYSPPAIPSFKTRDIDLNPNSTKVLFIDYENIRQVYGPQILLIGDSKGQYFYLTADFWKSDSIYDKNKLRKASKNLIQAKRVPKNAMKDFIIKILFFLLMFLFPFLLFKNIMSYRKLKISNRQTVNEEKTYLKDLKVNKEIIKLEVINEKGVRKSEINEYILVGGIIIVILIFVTIQYLRSNL